MTYVDSHCHISRYEDPLGVLRAAEAADVVTVAVTETPSEFQRLALRLGRRRLLRVALGLHPLRAATASPMDLALFGQQLDRVEYVGEVGLDKSREGRATYRQQVKVFEHLLGHPGMKDKVLTVHSRGAEADVVERLAAAEVTAILHWYSGAQKHLDAAVGAGLWFSVNAAMLRSKNGQKIIQGLPRARVVTETDGPYVKVDGRTSEPRDIPNIVRSLAEAWNEDPDETGARIIGAMGDIAKAAKNG